MKLHSLVSSVTVSLSILLAILVLVHGDGDPHPSTYCRRVKCLIAAAEIIVSLNQSVNPCNDFYAHACAGQKTNPFYYLPVTIHKQISDLFKNIQPGDMEALKKSKQFQDACTDQAAIKRQGLTPVERILSDNGEWPVTVPSDQWNNRHLDWQEIHANFSARTGISALFDVTVEIDRNNSGVHILSLGVPTVPSERAPFIARTKRDTRRSTDYLRYLATVVEEMKKLRGFDVEYGDMLADCQGIIAFEDELDKITIYLDGEDNENVDDSRITTIGALQNDWDAVVPKNYSINWLNVINNRFQGTGIVINASEKIALKPGAFVEKFARALVNTPVRTIVNYIHWKVVDNLLPLTSANISHPYATERAVVANVAGLCINNHKMIHAVAYMYVKKYLSLETKTAALEIVRNITDEMKREISGSSWLDEATKSVARKKIDTMKNSVGYPEWYDEPGKIDEYYRELTVGPDHFENFLAYNKFEAKKKMSKLRSSVDKSETESVAALPYFVNAEYLQQPNSLIVPAAILQSPFFVFERPSVLNYGSLGAIVGHEIAHGFDPIGRHYDEAGNKRIWWSQSAIDTYKTKAQCFVKQYDKYTISDVNDKIVHLNGTETQRENIVDTTGFRTGFRAYQRLREDGKTNNWKIRLLSNFTDDQLYFYGLVNTLCVREPARAEAFKGLDAHSPQRLRIIGALSNMQEFADAFHCPPGSPMNPSEKCLIWD